MQIKLANPRGFCAGVDRAIEIVNRALEVFGPPIYVRHEVVHNKFVVEDLRNRGAIFVEELDQVPDDVIVIFSAHGVSQAVRQEAAGRGLKVFDATCPLVTKVHIEVAKYSRDGRECILIGHEGHPEVEGTMGQYDASNGGAIYLVEDEEDVANLQVKDPELQKTSELDVYAGPSTRYCPAGVYEWVQKDGKDVFVINAQNCVHCKTCDIKDPNQNINWVPPQGGEGPVYPSM